MLVYHFHAQDAADLGQRLQVIDVDDEGPQRVVEDCAETFHVVAENWKKSVGLIFWQRRTLT